MKNEIETFYQNRLSLFRWISADFGQPSPQNLIQNALPSVINPHSTTIAAAAAPRTCKPLHRSTPGWGALNSDGRGCRHQYEEHVPKQASSGEPAWSTSSRAATLGLVQGILDAMDILFQTLAKERRGLWYYDPVRPLKEVEDLNS